MDVGQAVRQRREALGLSLRLAARQVGVDAAYLSRVEAGKVPPSEQLIGRLAVALDCSEDELLLLSGRLPGSLREMVGRDPERVSAALRSVAEMAASEPATPYGEPLFATRGVRAIEDGFPFDELSEIAEVESWRKEIYRPIYHVHKWWAQRLGSVFRAAVLGAAVPRGSSIMELFYQPVRLPGVVVFDPFMGSGTTVGEARKLGCTVIGRDINPVAVRAVKTALGPLSRRRLIDLYTRLETSVGKKLRRLYESVDGDGEPCDVLYFFWVKVLPCPACRHSVDLFPSYLFARHAYVRRHPTAQVVCPECGDVFRCAYDRKRLNCPSCGSTFDPRHGPAKRTTAQCRNCGHEFPIAKTARAAGEPPAHRMYAKLVLRQDGTKEYLAITEADVAAFESARRRLKRLAPPLPRVPIREGFNTRQILNYGYRSWHQLFNDRQLLSLALLGQAIRDLPAGAGRDALATLFSGVLEFNNMFASYKGEGTGAVRHMFSHHILKPERMPIEANPWGTPKSSGAFSTLFRSRLLRALDYRDAPFELAVEHAAGRKRGRKILGVSPPMGGEIVEEYPAQGLPPGSIYLSTGSSMQTDLPAQSVDLVITDPPFFDNVHYSELADFFHVWQELYFQGDGRVASPTTRDAEEVQDVDPQSFAEKLRQVFQECHRVLRPGGMLIFSYHHSREEGWSAVAQAVLGAGFSFVESQPVKSEMSVAAPKSQAREPIDLDVLLVCRKKSDDKRKSVNPNAALQAATETAAEKVARFNVAGRQLSRNDVRVVTLSQLLVELCAGRSASQVDAMLTDLLPATAAVVEEVWHRQELPGNVPPPRQYVSHQLDLFR